ncbi:TnsA endonuclease N-terminal domain-containing protein [Paenibacillus glycinis]|uniref:Heteromeric transposase endonuclease subunit TnsA n=1 Tax=Paenibacillus glycinis TaxID=2697035 RepID=A0ABW9XSU2_9BACL|nr:TnsA endonuclease N-terminal domain-containing protein [Paenibacillus glycinis]NBD25548.1 heteromeric transposase endonuclease subunit TnsA [Paenibacillus glycinis]
MAKKRTRTTASSIARRIKEGRGTGHYSQYRPWLTIHDVPSIGVVTRILGWKSGRLHHYLSEHFELAHHFQMDWSEDVIDIREQYPLLPLEKTLYIAQKLGIRHPVDPKTKHPIVMTTDMLLTLRNDDVTKFVAHSIKPMNQLNKRTLEKLQIEKEFFKDDGIEWALITEKQINYDLVKNVEWLHSTKSIYNNSSITKALVDQLQPDLYAAITQSDLPLAKVTLAKDQQFALPKGTCIQIVKHLIANRYWVVDMCQRIMPTLKPLHIHENKYPRTGGEL